jgi:tRNA pseudouridine55 synthase
MDGLFVIDKPIGPTSHDVVARARALLRERRVGHAGTLDPGASGVLLLVVGRATRLAQFLSGADKSYDALVRLGSSTDSRDSAGEPEGAAHAGPLPDREAIERVLDGFRGTFLQRPPAFSAKKIGGVRSHRLARARRQLASKSTSETAGSEPREGPAPVPVTARAITLVDVEGDLVSLSIDCSAGFYVRALAHDLGERLGVGAHLAGLRRTRSGRFTLAEAASLEALQGEAEARLVPPAAILAEFAAVTLNDQGVWRAGHGSDLRPDDVSQGWPAALEGTQGLSGTAVRYRLLDADGALVGIAERRAGGVLHPAVVLM